MTLEWQVEKNTFTLYRNGNGGIAFLAIFYRVHGGDWFVQYYADEYSDCLCEETLPASTPLEEVKTIVTTTWRLNYKDRRDG